MGAYTTIADFEELTLQQTEFLEHSASLSRSNPNKFSINIL